MARSVWGNRSWWRRFFWRGGQQVKEPVPQEHGLYPLLYFKNRLIQERRRAERSHRPLLLMLLNSESLTDGADEKGITETIGESVHACFRGTDICGIIKEDGLIGVILTEVEADQMALAQRVIASKTREKLAATLRADLIQSITIGFRIYSDAPGGDIDLIFYPDLIEEPRSGGGILKRSVDVVGSIAGLILFSPFFTLLPILIKLTSAGPVFFRQERIGRNGRKFKVLKFRSMYLDNDDVIHRDYVRQLIQGRTESSAGVFKIKSDPRVTPLGRYLRKYSLDELPQFLNVLIGDMSIVGPRPPIRYEVEHYQGWQRNRLIGKKPGITGLWQVTGRSTTTFDEMVRIDLKYLHGWSIRLDLKIMLQTPLAMLKAKGAY